MTGKRRLCQAARAAMLGSMKLNVHSEIGHLREVLVHAPGREVDVMPPSMMEDLLFDDILHGPRARSEHRVFRAIMERFGVRVHDAHDLLREALDAAPSEAVAELVGEVDDLEGLGTFVCEELRALTARRLADVLVHGLEAPPAEREPGFLFLLPPIPNLLFTRDPQVVLDSGVIFGSMSKSARRREALLMRFVFRFHPRLAGTPVFLDLTRRPRGAAWPMNAAPTLEGGDVLVFHEGVLLVGVSERTMEPAVDRLVRALRPIERFHTLIMVPMPSVRAAMHLDTIFTRISEDECLVYPPMILPGSVDTLSVISIDLRSPDDWGRRRPSLLEALKEVGVDLRPVCCGGPDDYIQQAREQWTDGANSFAIAPGVLLLYERNTRTAAELAARGYHLVSVTEMRFDEDGRCLYDFIPGKRYAILMAGEELSRARGGPRCMTMPLVRDAVS